MTNIDSLESHSKVYYLQLANNVNLKSVKYIQHCKSLNYIYLDNNVNMSTTELDEALNGTNSNLGITVLISNCQNSYKNIPKKYWDLFYGVSDVLDFSYATLGEYLTADSPKWVKLNGRTSVKKLSLAGQKNLTNETLQNVLSSLSGMVALNLSGVSQLSSLDFLGNMPKIFELDIGNINPNCTDWTILNNCSKLNRLLFTNNSIDFASIAKFINSNKYIQCRAK